MHGDLTDGAGLITCERTLRPIDQTILLSLDQVDIHHRDVIEVNRRGVEEVEKVEDPTTTNANET